MLAYLWVAIGGALGSLCRFGVAGLMPRNDTSFPWGILVINITGSFLIGIFAALNRSDGRMGASPTFQQFFMTGICGGYTTFSAFSLDTLRALQNGQILYAGGNVILSVTLCLIAVWLGYMVGGILNAFK